MGAGEDGYGREVGSGWVGVPGGGDMSGMFYKAFYTCEKVRDFMYDYLEGDLPSLVAMRFHLHLNGCAECREYLYLYRTAANSETFRKENPAPEEFLASTLAFLEKEGIVTAEDAEDAGDDGDVTDPGRGPTNKPVRR